MLKFVNELLKYIQLLSHDPLADVWLVDVSLTSKFYFERESGVAVAEAPRRSSSSLLLLSVKSFVLSFCPRLPRNCKLCHTMQFTFGSRWPGFRAAMTQLQGNYFTWTSLIAPPTGHGLPGAVGIFLNCLHRDHSSERNRLPPDTDRTRTKTCFQE